MTGVEFVDDTGIVYVDVRLRRRHLVCPHCGWQTAARLDRQPEPSTWRASDLGTRRALVRGGLRRLRCEPCATVVVETVPFGRYRARFTRDFDDLVAWLAQRCDKTAITDCAGSTGAPSGGSSTGWWPASSTTPASTSCTAWASTRSPTGRCKHARWALLNERPRHLTDTQAAQLAAIKRAGGAVWRAHQGVQALERRGHVLSSVGLSVLARSVPSLARRSWMAFSSAACSRSRRPPRTS